jgi:signal transduction histidine kinase
MNIFNLKLQQKRNAEAASLQDFELLQDKIAVVVIRLLFGFIVIPMLWNYINGFYVRSFIQLLAVVAFAICIFLANKNIYRDARDWIMIAGMYNITITSLVTNGGFTAPAGMIAVAGFVGVSMTCTGSRRTNEILFVALVSVVIVLLLQVYGYIPAYDNTSFAGGWTFMLSFLLAMFLLGFSHSTQRQFLTQAVTAKEDALKASQSAQQAESRFLSNMSHEIRNPLSGVLGLIQLSLEESDPAKFKQNLKTALLAGKHLHNIVDDILTLKKLTQRVYRIIRHQLI